MTGAGSPVYCVDTSALIAAWDERYPQDHFPGLWDEIAALVIAGRLNIARGGTRGAVKAVEGPRGLA